VRRDVPRGAAYRSPGVHQANASTKHQIVSDVAHQFPELARQLPPARKPWMSEDERMAIFDAAALAVIFFDLQ
jgi:hypothetical protein